MKTLTNVNTKVVLTGENMKELKNIAKVFKVHKHIDVLNHMKLDVMEDNQLNVTYNGYSGDLLIQKTLQPLNIETTNKKSFLFPMEVIKKITGIKKDSLYTIEVTEDNTILFNNNGIKQTLNTLDVEEYPQAAPERDFQTIGEVTYADLLILKAATISASKSETRPTLTNVTIRENQVISTDSHRLYRGKLEHVNSESDIMVQPVLIDSVMKNANKKNFAATLKTNDYYVQFETENAKYSYRQQEGNYPEISRLIPIDFNHVFTIEDVSNFKNVIEACHKISKEVRNNVIQFEIKDQNTLIVKTEVPEVGKVEQEVFINSDRVEEGFKIHFSSQYLLEAMKQLEDKNTKGLTFNIVSAMRPFIINNVGEEEAFSLILPVRMY